MSTAHLSVTSSENRKNNFYVTKEESRVAGPYYSESYYLSTSDAFVPRQIRDLTEESLYPWQQDVVLDCKGFNPRTINVIVDRQGNHGKSTLVSYMLCKVQSSLEVPPVHDFKDVSQFIGSMVKQSGRGCAKNIFIDFPRSRDQTKIHQFMSGIERIKDGRLFDTRYAATSIMIDSPNIWMFTNIVLRLDYVSMDRWRFYTIDRANKLVPLNLSRLSNEDHSNAIVDYFQSIDYVPGMEPPSPGGEGPSGPSIPQSI